MLEGSYSSTCTHMFIHAWNEPSCLYSIRICQMAPPEWGKAHLVTADYLFIDLKRMKGWVVLLWGHTGELCKTGELTEMPFRGLTHVGPRNHKMGSRSDKSICIRKWWQVCDAAFYHITLDSCLSSVVCFHSENV